MQENLFYLSGPHGSGKTTLAKRLAEAEPSIMLPALYARNVKFNDAAPEQRHVLKMASRAIENHEYLKIAKSNSGNAVLGNRCIYDVRAYNLVYLRKGWISREEFDFFSQMIEHLFKCENSAPYAVMLNPGIEAVTRHLHARWKETGKKWREDDLEYARIACEAYEMFAENPDICYIDHEIDLSRPCDIAKTLEWIEKRFKPVNLETKIDRALPHEKRPKVLSISA